MNNPDKWGSTVYEYYIRKSGRIINLKTLRHIILFLANTHITLMSHKAMLYYTYTKVKAVINPIQCQGHSEVKDQYNIPVRSSSPSLSSSGPWKMLSLILCERSSPSSVRFDKILVSWGASPSLDSPPAGKYWLCICRLAFIF